MQGDSPCCNPVRVISLEDLITNKRSSGRTKDLADAEILEELGK